MRNLLLITFHFPPDAEIGGVRPYQLAKHLPDHGFIPWILTVDPAFAESPDLEYQSEGLPMRRILRTQVDKTLADRIQSLGSLLPQFSAAKESRALPKHGENSLRPESPRADMARSLRRWAKAWLRFPDDHYGWCRPALNAGKDLLGRESFDVILSTSPPRVAHMIASALSEGHGIPWVMDLRDPWYSAWSQVNDGSRLLTRLQTSLFKRYASGSALVITNTEPLRREVERALEGRAPRTACVPNGFDPAVLAHDGNTPTSFSIGYFGQIMGRRSAGPFLVGLHRWLSQNPSALSALRVRFVGSGFDEAQRVATSLGLRAISFEPAVPRAEVARLMAQQYGLLLLANDQPLQIPGKAYEYLAASRRILAYTERDSATSEILSRAPDCRIAESPDEVAHALDAWWREYRNSESAFSDRDAFLESLTYRRRAEEVAELLREAAQQAASQ